jgi:hypothetical protein
MQVAGKATVERTGGKLIQNLKNRTTTAKQTATDVFKRRYMETATDGGKQLKKGKVIRDGLVAAALAFAAFFGIQIKNESNHEMNSGMQLGPIDSVPSSEPSHI